MQHSVFSAVAAGAVLGTALIAATPVHRSPVRRGPETAGSAEGFVNSIGSNAHMNYTDKPYVRAFSNVIFPRLQELGILHLRIGGTVTPDDRYMKLIYANVAQLNQKLGITFDIVMGQLQNDSTKVPFDRLFQYLDPKSVDMVEGLNEPDYPDKHPNWVAQTTAWQKSLYSAVKADSRLSGKMVVGPALVHHENAANAIGDITPEIDMANIHPYPGGQEPAPNLPRDVARLQAANQSRPYVVTETGYHTAVNATRGQPGVSELAMGKYMPRLFFEYWNFGVRRTYQYEFIDEGTDPNNAEDHFGLLHFDGSPKPAFTALKNVIAILKDPNGGTFTPGSLDYSLSGASDMVHHTLLEKSDGRFYLVLWQAVPSYDLRRKADISVKPQNVQVRFSATPKDVKVYRPNSGAESTADQQSQATVSVPVDDQVTILEVTP